MKTKYLLLLLLMLVGHIVVQAQLDEDRFELLEEQLDRFSKQETNLNKKIDISALGTVSEIIMAVAQQTKLNITIDPQLKQAVDSNFSKVKIKDLLLYLCRQYDLDLAFSGSIITVFPHKKELPVPKEKELAKYNAFSNKLSLDAKAEPLDKLLRSITRSTGQNVVASKKAQQLAVSVFVEKAEVEDALGLLARANELQLSKTDEGAFYLALKEEEVDPILAKNKNAKNRLSMGAGVDYQAIQNLSMLVTTDSFSQEQYLDIEAIDIPLLDLIQAVSIELGQNYFLFEEGGANRGRGQQRGRNNNSRQQNGTASNPAISMKLSQATYSEFLDYILTGTSFTYKLSEGIYLIGDREQEGLRTAKVVQLQNRSAQEIEKVIPSDLQERVDIQPFLELNAVLLSGAAPEVAEIEAFLQSIDKLVPVVNIELIILDVQRSLINESNLEMGLGESPASDQATLTPGVSFSFGAETINRLLNTLAGRGIVNLGRVVPNFYVSMGAVEDAGLIKTKSRPQLSTLNSHEATFTVGETRYYQETRTTVQGVQGTVTQQDINFKSVQANFTIGIRPQVSGDEQITVDITVSQSDFTGETQIGAPPAQYSRTFESALRVRNGEMIVLGGLSTKRKEESAKGAPFLARIPLLNLLGSRKKTKSDSELLIFIKPTIVY
ncbi:type II secretory pathway, component PulD [Saprospira grandis DSM 2844]|uniref:Type II secretory pathway, component PulD n=1 Tax=Saprospira grandis DSM 2844 TaxID=694433 RepID=J1HZK0_9BACT|nr:type II secretory pathway, component PulD [Saprospira grandis]EJF51810.1 type II secretory pathway, component PulD [Saprospira grandis DSM 2844]